jgi:hypothetical protein
MVRGSKSGFTDEELLVLVGGFNHSGVNCEIWGFEVSLSKGEGSRVWLRLTDVWS